MLITEEMRAQKTNIPRAELCALKSLRDDSSVVVLAVGERNAAVLLDIKHSVSKICMYRQTVHISY